MNREGDEARLVDVGWIIAGPLGAVQREAVERARRGVLQFFRERLPEFQWRMALLEHRELAPDARAEIVALLDAAVIERNIRHWDFALVITGRDLISHYQPDAIAALSRSLDSAVVSTCRIDPVSTADEITAAERTAVLAQRIQAIMIHACGHLCGLGHESDEGNYMFDFETKEDLDRAERLSESQLDELRGDLREVADQRLEEQRSARRFNAARFYLKAAWINRVDILESLYEARPWQFVSFR